MKTKLKLNLMAAWLIISNLCKLAIIFGLMAGWLYFLWLVGRMIWGWLF